MSYEASLAQLNFVESLAHQARQPIDLSRIRTKSDASDMIEHLQRNIEISDRTRAAVFAALKGSGRTKDDMYAALDIDSLSASGTASEFDGKRCMDWIRGHITEILRVPASNESFVDQLAAEVKKPRPRGRPGRPLFAPTDASIQTPAKVAPRRTGRPPAPNYPTAAEEAPRDALPGIDRDPATGAMIPFVVAPQELTDDQIDAVCLGVTLESAGSVLCKLRELGVQISRSGIRDHWGLWTSEKSASD